MPKKKTIQFDIVTIFPEMVKPYFKESILGKAIRNKLIKFKAHNLRKWSKDKHRHVDDRPYGGGPGMVMMVEPFDRAVKAVKKIGFPLNANGDTGPTAINGNSCRSLRGKL